MHSKSFQTGFSNHHHMIYTTLSRTFNKLPPKKIIYRDYKNCCHLHFEDDLKRTFASAYPFIYRHLESIFMKTLDENAPSKTKIYRGNKKSHMNRTLHKTIMKRSTLKRIANKTKREDNIRKYIDQRNLVVKLNISKNII